MGRPLGLGHRLLDLEGLQERLLQGAAVHEVILRAKGFLREGAVSTEAMVRAPLGAQWSLPIEKDGLAVFEPKKGKP